MAFIQYHLNSGRKISWHSTERGARISLAASNRNAGSIEYSVMEESEFERKHNPMVSVKNLMTGEFIMIHAQDKGGPCDPSTERYWSM